MKSVSLVALALGLAGTSLAADYVVEGQATERSGFYLTAGAGLERSSTTYVNDYGMSELPAAFGYGLTGKLGFALGRYNQHALYLTHHRSNFTISDYTAEVPVANSLSGIGYTYYFGQTSGEPYFGFAFGLGRFDLKESQTDLLVGSAAKFEVGYEITNNIQAGLYSMATATIDPEDEYASELLIVSTLGVTIEAKL
ncbi:hypothetical protein [Salinibius halmophilus]|uniref:hypothetical protein n=1 Tax=Salinibius halmophilus TaxID=1853216 RepID=UPI000E66715E|nr:hypothetical protein [Salinibius halmophilus]